MNTEIKLNPFDKAFVATQLAIKNPQFDCNVDYQPKDKTFKVKYEYASLNEVLRVIREAANPNGIYVTQSPQILNDKLVLVTRIAHESGEFRESIFPLSVDLSKDWKDKGSAITYARRYVLCSLFGIFGADDDDGIESDDRFSTKEDEKNLLSFMKIKENKAKEIKALLKKAGEIDQKIVGEFWMTAKCSCFEEIKESDYDTIIRSLTGRIHIEGNKGVK